MGILPAHINSIQWINFLIRSLWSIQLIAVWIDGIFIFLQKCDVLDLDTVEHLV